MNVKLHHTTRQLLKLYKTEPYHRLARRIHGVHLAGDGLTCPEIMKNTGTGSRINRTIQKWGQCPTVKSYCGCIK